MQGQLLPELSEIAVLRTKNAVLHSLSVLALQVAETASKEVVFVVQAVATTLDVSRHEFCEQDFPIFFFIDAPVPCQPCRRPTPLPGPRSATCSTCARTRTYLG